MLQSFQRFMNIKRIAWLAFIGEIALADCLHGRRMFEVDFTMSILNLSANEYRTHFNIAQIHRYLPFILLACCDRALSFKKI